MTKRLKDKSLGGRDSEDSIRIKRLSSIVMYEFGEVIVKLILSLDEEREKELFSSPESYQKSPSFS
jgi:hypothetical protein